MRTIFKQRLDVCEQQTIELPQDFRMDDLPPMEHIGIVQTDGYVWHYYRRAGGFIDRRTFGMRCRAEIIQKLFKKN